MKPLCEFFGECGGCAYQDISYPEELAVKERWAREILAGLKLKEKVFRPVMPSPREYHYRNRLDLSYYKTKAGEHLVGFKPKKGPYTVQIDSCAIAQKEISGFIPKLRRLVKTKLPKDYTIANLVVKSGDNGRVFWGGAGRRSLELPKKDYLWTKIGRRKIFYSLDTFFQANLSILPRVVDFIRSLPVWKKNTVFFDLYSGVGLFGICLSDLAKKVVMIEEGIPSLVLARYNVAYHKLKNVEIREGKVEEILPLAVATSVAKKKRLKPLLQTNFVAFIDPPRKGLSDSARQVLVNAKKFSALLYLSCNPESLARDLLQFKKKGWKIECVAPFDFFPKTKHLETLVWMKP